MQILSHKGSKEDKDHCMCAFKVEISNVDNAPLPHFYLLAQAPSVSGPSWQLT